MTLAIEEALTVFLLAVAFDILIGRIHSPIPLIQTDRKTIRLCRARLGRLRCRCRSILGPRRIPSGFQGKAAQDKAEAKSRRGKETAHQNPSNKRSLKPIMNKRGSEISRQP